jgi:Type I phosphodiesterase / nucleotide pyrophosphatase
MPRAPVQREAHQFLTFHPTAVNVAVGTLRVMTQGRDFIARCVLSALGLGLVLLSAGSPVAAADQDHSARHVLLISVDGLHEFDLEQWTSTHPKSELAKLRRDGTTYTNARTTSPSDSFPGLLSMVTGGTSKFTGVFYDDSYSRNFFAPGNTQCSGRPGTETVYDESIDKTVNGQIPLFTSIDPARLPLAVVADKCTPIFPHSFLQVNTIFNVAHAAGLHTAWSDKHPAYEIVRGPADTGAEDLFTPEINNVNDPTAVSVAATAAYDQLKVQAVLNEINGKSSDGAHSAPVPAIFGMNFQAVSVGQKLVDPVKSCVRNPGPTCDPTYVPGGYEPGSLAFTPQLAEALAFVDGALASMVDALDDHGLMRSTEVIISAKHGQAPIDPSRLRKIGDAVTPILTAAGVRVAQNTEDDISLIWLSDQRQTAAAVAALQANKAGSNSARIQTIYSGDRLADRWGDPLKNNRTPDVIVQPIHGTIYTTSKAKVAEHGGFSDDDTHVAMLVVGGDRDTRDGLDSDHDGPRTIRALVGTTQIAPTILKFLGLDPRALEAVRLQHIAVLPGLDD